jgi:hypothetical protein
VFEWIIAIGYSLYLLTFWYDLHLSKGVNEGDLILERLSALRGEMRETGDSARPSISAPA